MANECTIFRFARSVPMREVEMTLHLARVATASLHGEDRVRIQAPSSVDRTHHLCRIDTTRDVGQALSLIFGGYVRHEFGDDAVQVERVTSMQIDEAYATVHLTHDQYSMMRDVNDQDKITLTVKVNTISFSTKRLETSCDLVDVVSPKPKGN